MERYFFHIEDGETLQDEQGLELRNIEAARQEAVAVMAQYLRDRPDDIWNERPVTVTVQDDQGMTLFCVITSGHNAAAVGGKRVADRPGGA